MIHRASNYVENTVTTTTLPLPPMRFDLDCDLEAFLDKSSDNVNLASVLSVAFGFEDWIQLSNSQILQFSLIHCCKSLDQNLLLSNGLALFGSKDIAEFVHLEVFILAQVQVGRFLLDVDHF